MRAAFEAWNRDDFEETLQYVSDEVVWRPGGLFPGIEDSYAGHDGLRRFWRDFSEPWDEIRIDLEEVIHEKQHELLVRARFRARGRESIEVDASFFQLYRYDDEGLLTEFDAFGSEDEARRTAGLET